MQSLHRSRLLPDLPGIAPAMGLGRDAARPAVQLQHALDKAEAHAKHPGELPLGSFPALAGTDHFQPKVR
jgi:hypothetical protein